MSMGNMGGMGNMGAMGGMANLGGAPQNHHHLGPTSKPQVCCVCVSARKMRYIHRACSIHVLLCVVYT
jgi:hypothetical protein